jgi:hypothetical protein
MKTQLVLKTASGREVVLGDVPADGVEQESFCAELLSRLDSAVAVAQKLEQAKREHVDAVLNALSTELWLWMVEEGFQDFDGDAEELLIEKVDTLTPTQRAYLSEYIERWDGVNQGYAVKVRGVS